MSSRTPKEFYEFFQPPSKLNVPNCTLTKQVHWNSICFSFSLRLFISTVKLHHDDLVEKENSSADGPTMTIGLNDVQVHRRM